MLRDLTVQNYRCFEDFNIDGLEQVNLFVGNNNSGKTSLLEAIYLLVNPDIYRSLLEIMINRGEAKYIPSFSYNSSKIIILESVENFFYNHKIFKTNNIIIKGVTYENSNKTEEETILKMSSEFNNKNTNKIEAIKKGKNNIAVSFEVDSEYKLQIDKFIINRSNNILISNPQKNLKALEYIWNDIYLTEREDKVIRSLQFIEPEIIRVGFYSNGSSSSVKFRLTNKDKPVPLSSMGDGVYRFLLLSLTSVTAENGVLLVDEIETGLHYEAQTDMWRLILETAKELNVQVFATTHSWDCISAFQEALSQVEDSSIGKLFRLDSKYGKLRAVEYDADDLDVAVRQGIEVR